MQSPFYLIRNRNATPLLSATKGQIIRIGLEVYIRSEAARATRDVSAITGEATEAALVDELPPAVLPAAASELPEAEAPANGSPLSPFLPTALARVGNFQDEGGAMQLELADEQTVQS